MNSPQSRALADAARLRRELETLVRQADESEIVTAEIENPLWTKIIKPYIERTLTSFQASVYSLSQDEFVKHQGVANGLNALMVYLESMVGKRKDLLDEATKIKQKLEAAEKSGRIPRSREE